MSSYQGFWAYVHKDDKAEQGRISRLAKDVVAQYEMLTGESIELFLDKDALEWGDKWRDKIDDTLASVAFFIPVITPRYFMSPECRRELQYFARKADNLGIRELVLPLHYVDVSALNDEIVQDDLIALVQDFQWEDWRDLRFTDITSEAYRRGVSKLASRLVAANKHAEEASIAEAALQMEEIVQDERDNVPGLIDRLAMAEEALPSWTKTIEDISTEIEAIGELMRKTTSEINKNSGKAGKGFAYRVALSRRLANQLGDPTERISTLGNAFASQLHDVDEGFRIIIEQAPAEIKENPDSKNDLCEFFEIVRKLSSSAQGAQSNTQIMIDAIAPLENMSRDLRPVLRRLRQGLTVVVEAGEVTDSWVGLIEASGVDCRNIE